MDGRVTEELVLVTLLLQESSNMLLNESHLFHERHPEAPLDPGSVRSSVQGRLGGIMVDLLRLERRVDAGTLPPTLLGRVAPIQDREPSSSLRVAQCMDALLCWVACYPLSIHGWQLLQLFLLGLVNIG